MYRIGIIGAENSHAMAFSKLMNNDEAKRARVVSVMGPGDSADKIAREAGVEHVAKDAGEFMGKVDAMMITCRRGSDHERFAMPFIEAGIPLFIDKPFTSDMEGTLRLLRAAKAKNLPLCGGSGFKYVPTLLKLKETACEWRKEGALLAASMNYAADPDSEYDGFHFYAPHLTQIAITVLGDNVESVQAVTSENCVLVTARYADLLASLHYTKGSKESTCTLYGKTGNVTEIVGMSSYVALAERFLEMLDTGRMPEDYVALAKPVQILCAIVESMKTGKTVAIEKLEV